MPFNNFYALIMTCIELIFFIAFLFNSIAYSSRIGGFISLITLKPESTAKIFIFYKIKTMINKKMILIISFFWNCENPNREYLLYIDNDV